VKVTAICYAELVILYDETTADYLPRSTASVYILHCNRLSSVFSSTALSGETTAGPFAPLYSVWRYYIKDRGQYYNMEKSRRPPFVTYRLRSLRDDNRQLFPRYFLALSIQRRAHCLLMYPVKLALAFTAAMQSIREIDGLNLTAIASFRNMPVQSAWVR
jgi:hypothetical protein